MTEANAATASSAWRSRGDLRVWLLNAALTAGAVVLFLRAVRHLEPVPAVPALPWLAVLAAFVVAEVVVVHLRFGRSGQSLSLTEVPLIAGLFAFDPVALVVLRVVVALSVKAVHWRQRAEKLAFNVAWAAVETQIALLVWHGVVGGANPLGPRGWFATLLAIAVMDVLSSVAIAGAISLSEGRVRPRLCLDSLTGGALTVSANTGLGIVVVTMLSADWRSLWAVGVVAAVLVVAYRAYHSVRIRHDNVERLYRFTRAVGAQVDAESVARILAEHARELLRADVAEVVLHDDDTLPPLRVLLRGEAPSQTTERTEASLAHLCTGGAVDGPVRYPRGRQPAALQAAGLRETLIVPLTGDSLSIGTILVGHRSLDSGTFEPTHVTLLETLANHASVALHNARLLDDLKTQAGANRHQALHDTLTGLPNRRLFNQRVVDTLNEGAGGSILVMDLDGFKDVNDTLGHEVGDRVLQEVGKRLRATLPDRSTVARLGGDEFAVLLPGMRRTDDAEEAARDVHAALEVPVEIGDLTLAVGTSVGIAMAPLHGEDADVLLQRGDVAMYVAKKRGRSTELYDGDLDGHSPRRLALGVALQQAAALQEFTLHYQPKIDLQSGQVVGVEALLRWQHPTYGFVPPDEFIPLAERTGLIVPITDMVLEMALTQCRAWQDMGRPLGMAVNVATQCLLDWKFPQRVGALLARTGVAPQALTLELTESGMLTEPGRTTEVIARLNKMGVALSIDDFGTGYSSLSRLRDLPVRELKVDRSFVKHMVTDVADDAVVRSTIDLGRNLGLRVVAEGIEDRASFERLNELGCDAGQGYWISRPIEAAALERWLEQHMTVAATDPAPPQLAAN